MKKRDAILLFIGFLPFLLSSQMVMIDGVLRDTSYTIFSAYNKIKKNYPDVGYVDENSPKNISETKDITYKTINSERKLKLTIFNPKNKKTYPVVLMIHGGGWNSGSPDLLRGMAIHLAEKGFATVIVEYRLIPEALYPAAVEDITDAVDWIYENNKKYNFDKNKIAILGCSAGGQLAALIGTKNTKKRIKAIVNVDGSTDFVVPETVDRAEKAKLEGTKKPVDALWLGGTYSEKPENWKNASPVNWININTPPIFFICSSIPRFHNGRDEYIKKLNQFGIYSKVYTFENCPHSFWLYSPWHSPTIERINIFLKNILQK